MLRQGYVRFYVFVLLYSLSCVAGIMRIYVSRSHVEKLENRLHLLQKAQKLKTRTSKHCEAFVLDQHKLRLEALLISAQTSCKLVSLPALLGTLQADVF